MQRKDLDFRIDVGKRSLKLVEIVWHILLTVCLNSDCKSQEVNTFADQKSCEIVRQQYTEIPADGHWDTVTYICKPQGSVSL